MKFLCSSSRTQGDETGNYFKPQVNLKRNQNWKEPKVNPCISSALLSLTVASYLSLKALLSHIDQMRLCSSEVYVQHDFILSIQLCFICYVAKKFERSQCQI